MRHSRIRVGHRGARTARRCSDRHCRSRHRPCTFQRLESQASRRTARLRDAAPQQSPRSTAARRYRHPLVGELELVYETLRLPGHPDLASSSTPQSGASPPSKPSAA
ncbi:hypothetical protein [Nocardia sp. NPDC005745]|uniref:MmyB family transcriptional regulator n=1 Tax=Nocardia sp. NPDC005745 TaxID=3157061 RepID=UPI0033C3C68C